MPAGSDVDTRALTIALRDGGTCRGFVGAGALVKPLLGLPHWVGVSMVGAVVMLIVLAVLLPIIQLNTWVR